MAYNLSVTASALNTAITQAANAAPQSTTYTKTETTTQINSLSYGVGTAIASGADLDDSKTIGIFYAADGTVAASLSNSPVTDAAFVMVVKNILDSSSYMQEIIRADGTPTVYRRQYVSSTWGSWYEFTGTAVV